MSTKPSCPMLQLSTKRPSPHNSRKRWKSQSSIQKTIVKPSNRFLSWLYTKEYDLSGYVTAEGIEERYLELARLYVLADKLGVGLLKNDIIDQLFNMKGLLINPPQSPPDSYIYANSTRRSAFRKLLVDWYTWHIDMNWYSAPGTLEYLSDLPELAIELAIALSQRVNNSRQSLFSGKSSAVYEDADTDSGGTLGSTGAEVK